MSSRSHADELNPSGRATLIPSENFAIPTSVSCCAVGRASRALNAFPGSFALIHLQITNAIFTKRLASLEKSHLAALM
jgi:hypothetical protein